MKPDLIINRVPIDVLEGFKKLSNDKFSGDYGMCLALCYRDSTEYNKIKEMVLNGDFAVRVNEKKKD